MIRNADFMFYDPKDDESGAPGVPLCKRHLAARLAGFARARRLEVEATRVYQHGGRQPCADCEREER